MPVPELTTARPVRRRRIGVDPDHEHYRWWVLSVTSLGMFLATVNSGTLLIALPDVERALDTSLLTLVWVILAYMVASTVLLLPAGRLADQLGRRRLYIIGMALFTLASLGAGFADSGTALILWRILQGIGGAFVFANSGALVTDAFPRRQLGLAMGTNVMVAAVGLVVGPVLGGWLVGFGWAWVFWFNVPLGVLGTIWSALILRELARRDHRGGYDIAGNLLALGGLTGLVLALSDAGLDGWSAPMVVVGLIAAGVLLPLFVLVELRAPSPMLDLSLFRIRIYWAASAAAFLNGLARFALMFLFVFYFQGPQGDDPITAGIKLIPLAAGMLVAAPLAGWWADRHGSRALAVGGMLLCALGLAGMTTLGVASPFWQSALWLGIVGVGSGAFNSPNTSAMMAAVPPWRRGIASGTRTMLQNTGAVISIALMLMIVTAVVPTTLLFRIFSGLTTGLSTERLEPFMSGMHLALWILVAFSLAGAAVSALRGKHVSDEADAEVEAAPAAAPAPREAEPAPAPRRRRAGAVPGLVHGHGLGERARALEDRPPPLPVERGEQRGEPGGLDLADLAQDLPPRRGEAHVAAAAVGVGDVRALHQPGALEPLHHPGCGGDRHAGGRGQVAHAERPVREGLEREALGGAHALGQRRPAPTALHARRDQARDRPPHRLQGLRGLAQILVGWGAHARRSYPEARRTPAGAAPRRPAGCAAAATRG
jgi:EmrB/QacA subfamily drug resistance transporter